MVQLVTQNAQEHDFNLCPHFQSGAGVSSFYGATSPHHEPVRIHVGKPTDGGRWDMAWGAEDILMFQSSRANSDWTPVETFTWSFSLTVVYQPASGGHPFSLKRVTGKVQSSPPNQNVNLLPQWKSAAQSPDTGHC